MSEIEKMQRYIERTKMGRADNYGLVFREVVELLHTATDTNTDTNSMFEIIALAFDYGKAKGYRAAKAEGRAKA